MKKLISFLTGQTRVAKSTKPATRTRLQIETLEDRSLLTVLFTPALGSESVAQNDGAALQHPELYLIFRGSYFGGTNTAVTQPYIQATQQLLNSGYLSGLTQYRSDGTAHLNTDRMYYTPDNSQPDPDPVKILTQGITQADSDAQHDLIGDTVVNATFNGPLPRPDTPSSTPIYVVVTHGLNDLIGAQGYNERRDYHHDIFQDDHLPIVWVSDDNGGRSTGSVDNFTEVLGHELAEFMSDFGGGGFRVNAGGNYLGNGGSQIGDNEPDGGTYRYRLNGTTSIGQPEGIMVQPYWSAKDGAYIVPDGDPNHNYVLNPSWSGVGSNKPQFNGTYTLNLNTTQKDNIVISESLDAQNNNVISINWNGHVDTFNTAIDPLSAINVTRSGSATVSVVGNMSIPVIGSYTSVSSASELSQNGVVNFVANGNDAVTLSTNAQGGLHIVSGARSDDFLAGTVSILNLQTNAGKHTVAVTALPDQTNTGGFSLNVNGTANSKNVLTLGGNGRTANTGHLSSLGAAVVTVTGNTDLTLDDGAEKSLDENYKITGSSIALDSGFTVNYTPSSSRLATIPTARQVHLTSYTSDGVSGITLLGGDGHNTFHIDGTAAQAPVTVHTGGSRHDEVWVGDGTLANIAGQVTVMPTHQTDYRLVVDVYLEKSRDASITSNQVKFSGAAPIVVDFAPRMLDVVGAAGKNTITINSLDPRTALTVYNTRYNTVVNNSGGNVKTVTKLPYWDQAAIVIKEVQQLSPLLQQHQSAPTPGNPVEKVGLQNELINPVASTGSVVGSSVNVVSLNPQQLQSEATTPIGNVFNQVALNPQPMPPEANTTVVNAIDSVSLDPQPLPPEANTTVVNAIDAVSLDPQPLPPEANTTVPTTLSVSGMTRKPLAFARSNLVNAIRQIG